MKILPNGHFSLSISGQELSKGLRNSARNPANNPAMLQCAGVTGREKILEKSEDLSLTVDIDSGVFPAGVTFGGDFNVTFGGDSVTFNSGVNIEFPFPQIFVETNLIVICTKEYVYEYEDGNLNLKYSISGGSTWSLISIHDFVFLSNGVVSLVRNPESKQYSLSNAPTAMAICNYNGQIIVGAPNAGYELGGY